VAALSALNASLPRVYRALAAAPSADAHCGYSTIQLFTEGVALEVRPPGQRWRPFGALSGGQQALAALALSFALQVGGARVGKTWVRAGGGR
jgi:chromosome segregation ATPase